jgi:hypothetical protein
MLVRIYRRTGQNRSDCRTKVASRKRLAVAGPTVIKLPTVNEAAIRIE